MILEVIDSDGTVHKTSDRICPFMSIARSIERYCMHEKCEMWIDSTGKCGLIVRGGLSQLLRLEGRSLPLDYAEASEDTD